MQHCSREPQPVGSQYEPLLTAARAAIDLPSLVARRIAHRRVVPRATRRKLSRSTVVSVHDLA